MTAWIEVTSVSRAGLQVLRQKSAFQASSVSRVEELPQECQAAVDTGACTAVMVQGQWMHVVEPYATVVELVKSSDFAS